MKPSVSIWPTSQVCSSVWAIMTVSYCTTHPPVRCPSSRQLYHHGRQAANLHQHRRIHQVKFLLCFRHLSRADSHLWTQAAGHRLLPVDSQVPSHQFNQLRRQLPCQVRSQVPSPRLLQVVSLLPIPLRPPVGSHRLFPAWNPLCYLLKTQG